MSVFKWFKKKNDDPLSSILNDEEKEVEDNKKK